MICCKQCVHYLFSLSKHHHYPWLYKQLCTIIDKSEIEELDFLLFHLVKNNIISSKHNMNNLLSIFNDNTLQKNPQINIQYSILCHQFVRCTLCFEHNRINANNKQLGGSIICQFRSSKHIHATKYGTVTLYCHTCNSYLDHYLS